MIIGDDLLSIRNMVQVTMFLKLLLTNTLYCPIHFIAHIISIALVITSYGNWARAQNSTTKACIFNDEFIRFQAEVTLNMSCIIHIDSYWVGITSFGITEIILYLILVIIFWRNVEILLSKSLPQIDGRFDLLVRLSWFFGDFFGMNTSYIR